MLAAEFYKIIESKSSTVVFLLTRWLFKIGSPGEVVQLDESLLRVKKNYHRGRILLDDQSAENIISDYNSDSDSDKENVANRRKQIYGQRIEWLWVFGLCCKKDGILERQFFMGECHDSEILIPIIQKDFIIGTMVAPDEWKLY